MLCFFQGESLSVSAPCPLAEEPLRSPQGWRASLLLDHHSPSAQWMSWAFLCPTVMVIFIVLSLVIGFCLRNLILKTVCVLLAFLLIVEPDTPFPGVSRQLTLGQPVPQPGLPCPPSYPQFSWRRGTSGQGVSIIQDTFCSSLFLAWMTYWMMIYLFNIHSVLTVLWSCPGPVGRSGQFSGHSSPPAEAPSEVGPGPSVLAQWCPWSWGNCAAGLCT